MPALALVACATPGPRQDGGDALIQPGAKVELNSVRIPPDNSYEIDAAGLMRTALVSALDERDMAWEGNPSTERLIFDVTVEDYEPGNAFKRWILPGFGATILHVSGVLTDASTGEVVGELYQERNIYSGGAFTIGMWENVFQAVAEDIVNELENRTERSGFVVALESWAGRDIEIPAAEVPQEFTISAVTDSRDNRGRIGERTAAFNVSMGPVFFHRMVPDFMEETVAAELRGAGHQVTENGSGRTISLDVLQFWTHTDTTALYWDVIANIDIAVTVDSGGSDPVPVKKTFRCETSDRTYVWPSLAMVTEVMDECLVGLMSDFRSDPVWQGQR